MDQRVMKAVSLFCGAGGMDIGFTRAGFQTVWANDFDKDACETYAANFGSHVLHGDINTLLPELGNFYEIDCLFGGPPCQGFSVAGNMDPNDDRSKLVMSYMNAVDILRPRVFVMENVKSLGTLEKFKSVRDELFQRAHKMGYYTELLILNSKDYGVPQSRERIFLFGVKNKNFSGLLSNHINKFKCANKTVREIIQSLGPAGSNNNTKVVNAKISFASSPILRKSPYAGMLFNGQGRPLNINTHSSTLHASMGGNRTPIVDEEQLYYDAPSWIEEYHSYLMSGGAPYTNKNAPSRLRRLTVDEAHLLQTFPENFHFFGKQSSVFRQIGNAVPCNLAEAVAKLAMSILDSSIDHSFFSQEINYELGF